LGNNAKTVKINTLSAQYNGTYKKARFLQLTTSASSAEKSAVRATHSHKECACRNRKNSRWLWLHGGLVLRLPCVIFGRALNPESAFLAEVRGFAVLVSAICTEHSFFLQYLFILLPRTRVWLQLILRPLS
jgi:hypothetical protein